MGYDLNSSMQEGIKNSTVVLVCLSQLYQTRPNCLKELHWASENKKTIVVLVLQPDVFSWVTEEVQELCQLHNHMFIDLNNICQRWKAISKNKNDEENIEDEIENLREELLKLLQVLDNVNCRPSLIQKLA